MNNIRKVGFICPMDCELDAVTRLMTEVTERVFGALTFYEGKIGACDAVAVKCGVGKVFAAIAAEAMILGFSPDLVINTGVAGNLSDGLSIGDVVVSESVVQHDMDTSPLGDPVGLVSGINVIRFPANDRMYTELSRSADALGINNRVGTIASGDQFIASSERKNFIKDNFSAIACEMEGAAIGHVCYVNDVPFAVVRAISDSADDSSGMDYGEFLALAAERSFGVVSSFVEKFEI